MARCDTYFNGECTKGACLAEGWIPDDLGNANQWLDRAAARGFALTDVPTVNAVAVFSGGGIYDAQFGHDAIVQKVASYESFEVLEMNFARWGGYDFRWASRAGLLGFILPPGTAAGAGGIGGPPGPGSSATLEAAWRDLTDVWNFVIDAEIVGLVNISRALAGIR